MEEKERRQEGQQQRRRRKKRNGKKRLRRERERQKRKRMALLLAEAGIVLALAILLAVFLLRGCGTQPEAAAAVAQGAGLQNLERLQEVTAEILAAEAEPSEEERVSTVKEVATETDEVTVGIDVSEYQGNIDWSQAAEGIDYVMVRVGYRSSETGEITEDACARYNLQEARDQGLYLGAYFFSTAVSEEEAREEARWVCELLKGYPITYPVAYNCEGFQNPDSRQYELTVDERSRIAEAFLDEVEAQGYTGMFYAARNELQGNTLWDTDTLELKYRIWVAQYGIGDYPDTEKPEYSCEHVMLQYTNQGSVNGIDGEVDRNVAYFGYSEASKPKA